MDTGDYVGGFLVGLLIFVLIMGCVGWCKNLYKLTQLDFRPPYKAEVLRVIGIVPVVGAFEGYFNIKDN